MTFLVTAIAQIDALLEAVDKVAVAPVDTAATPITDTPVIEKKQGKKKEKKSKTSVEPSAEVENTADSALNDPFYKCNLRVSSPVLLLCTSGLYLTPTEASFHCGNV